MRGALVVVAVLVGIVLVWGVSELHYQGCVDAAEARTYVEGCSRLPW